MRNLASAPILNSSRHSGEDHQSSEHKGKRLNQANPTGTRFKDILIGVEASDVVTGLGGSDVLKGMGGNDTLIGVNAVGKNPGRNEMMCCTGTQDRTPLCWAISMAVCTTWIRATKAEARKAMPAYKTLKTATKSPCAAMKWANTSSTRTTVLETQLPRLFTTTKMAKPESAEATT
ncbi:MAG: calcium-binding protein [Vulcanococcus sp.]|nr:calcium-binding protein [Vulcanococcus sp.]